MTEPRRPDFDARAARYDELRPADAAWWERYEALVLAGDLRGKRVLDVGCGTGRLAAALAERESAKVWGVDSSSGMLAAARETVPAGVGLKEGVGESLPFRDAWFERVVMSLVVHLLDRPQAFAEALRVLQPGGRLAIATFAPEHFDTYWLNGYFPSIARIDRERFPTGDQLHAELERAGFEAIRLVPVSTRVELERERALELVRGRHISTFDLLDEAELAEGTARVERELPERVETRLEQLVVTADHP